MMEHAEPRRLYRSRTDSKIAGVCAGLALYFGIDPVWIRLGFVALLLATGGVWLVAYIIMAIVVPEYPLGQAEPAVVSSGINNGSQVLAYLIIAVGVIILASNLGVFTFFPWHLFWPFVLIAVGAGLLVKRLAR